MPMDGFIGEIRAFAFNYVPQGWLFCNGSKASLQQYQALFSIVGAFYGPTDQKTYFTLPDLQGRTLLGANPSGSLRLGNVGGTESETLTVAQMPAHSHILYGDKRTGKEASLGTDTPTPQVFISNSLAATPLGGTPGIYSYSSPSSSATPAFNISFLGQSGAGASHENRMPYLTMMYCICYDGVYPVPD
jgi:microcystin-dependent protein